MSTEGREQDLLDWATGDLAAERKTQLDAHIRQCRECREMAMDLLSLSAGLERLGTLRNTPSSLTAHHITGMRVHGRRWATAATVALALGALAFLFDWPSGSVEVATPSPAVVPAAQQLRDVEAALGSGRASVLAVHARNSPSVPVRLTALSGPPQGSAALTPPELVAAFASESDPMVRIWLVVEVSRSGDADAARRLRGMVDDQDTAVDPELRSAVDSYLSASRPRGTS